MRSILTACLVVLVAFTAAAQQPPLPATDVTSAEITATPQFIPQMFVILGGLLLVIYLFRFIVTRCHDVP